jgi:alkanesulfonate monooxygenase
MLPFTLDGGLRLVRLLDKLGYTGALVTAGAGGWDPWILATYLSHQTRRLRFLIAQYVNECTPLSLAQRTATLAGVLGDRLELNAILGGQKTAEKLGIPAGHEERIAAARIYWSEWLQHLQGHPVPRAGATNNSTLSRLVLSVPRVAPRLMAAGSSEAGLQLAAGLADVWLTLALTPPDMAKRIAHFKELARAHRREVLVGIRINVMTRSTRDMAWATAQDLQNRMLPKALASRRGSIGKRGLGNDELARSFGLTGALPRHARDLEVYENIWCGIGYVSAGTALTIVGDAAAVESTLDAYRSAGVDIFVLGGYPAALEARCFAKLCYGISGIGH